MTEFSDPYHALARGVGFFDRSTRGRLDVVGTDRAKFLHNLTTNDVKRLAVDRGQEAFVTSLQGKTLGYVTLLACPDRILVRSDPDALALLMPHFQKYGMFDEVQLDDLGPGTFELHLAGAGCDDLIREKGADLPEAGDLDHRTTTIAGCPVRLIRESPAGYPGLTLIGALADGPGLLSRLCAASGASKLFEIPAETFDVLRIEAGTPVFGRDVTAENLPQEVGRDSRAISFVKGCYLGQETVARIDALGHVNKHLRGVRLLDDGPVPLPGAGIEVEGKRIGAITSSAQSPGWGAPVALAYVKSAFAGAGAEIGVASENGIRPALVCELPFLPPS